MEQKGHIDALRAVAAFGVVVIHVAAQFINPSLLETNKSLWWTAFALCSVFRFAVPVFLMISGSLLLGRVESWACFYRKRYSRLIPPFLFWNAVYFVFAAVFAGNQTIMERVLALALSWSAYSHLWYLPMLLFVLLFVPLVNNALTGHPVKDSDWRVMIAIGVGLLAFLSLSSFLSGMGLWLIDLVGMWPFLGYLLLGYFLDRKAASLRGWVPYVSALTVVCFCTGLIVDARVVGQGADFIAFSYLGITVCLMASAVFVLFRLRCSMSHAPTWLRQMADCSFGIYLVHPILIRAYQRAWGDSLVSKCPSFLVVPVELVVMAGCVYLVSFGLVYGLRKFAVGRRLC